MTKLNLKLLRHLGLQGLSCPPDVTLPLMIVVAGLMFQSAAEQGLR